MERVFPIRCTIFEDSPNLSGDHQRAEIHQQRTVVVESPLSERSEAAAIRPETSPALDNARFEQHEVRRWPPSVAVEEMLEAPPQGDPQLAYTKRCEYAYTDEQGHGIISGKRDHITRCEDEPIRTPGSIQSHGMLIGLETIEGPGPPRYVCRVVSENAEAICKYSPRVVFQLNSFLSVFPAHQRLIFESHARSVIATFKKTSKSAEPKVFSISFMDPAGYIIPAWCAMHFLGGDHNLLVCEFELEDSLGISQTLLDDLPSTPHNTLDSDPTDAGSSFIARSDPLNISGETVNMFQGEGRTMEVVNVMSQIQRQLSRATDVQELLDIIVAIIQEVTSYHRCMVYQFDEEYNGTVVAELINPQACSDIYRGLHFPASDIPKQARDLYRINRVRVLFDREREVSRLICRDVTDLDTPLDLTHSYLRAMSPVHLRYLGNMGVRSTMSVSLDYKNELWGLICCHSYGPTGLRVSFPVRELCYWVGQCASNCLDKLLNAEKLKARDSLISMQIDVSPQICISASSDDLLRLFQADFGFLVVKGEARTIGKLTSYPESVTLLRYVYFRDFATTYATKNISDDFTDLVFEPGFEHIAGLLVIPLSHDAGDFIVFFRKNRIREVHWAGNPNMAKKIGALEPRNSFKKWTETVKGTCKPWSGEQFEAAAMTRLVYGNFIRVWREKEATLHESRLKRLLLLNLSHEVRTPLNAVVNYLEIALEKPLDEETKEVLTQSHSASKSLIYVVDDLLHLTDGSFQAPLPMIHITFELLNDIQTTLDQLRKHAVQRELYFDVKQDDNVPRLVCSDLQRFQQALTHLVTNAIRHTEKGGVSIHIGARAVTDQNCILQVAVHDTGTGMSERDLDDLFQEFEQVPDEDIDSIEVSMREQREEFSEGKRAAKLGLGLALVARYIKQCGGQIRGRSIKGEGSTFSLDIPMQLVKEDTLTSLSRSTTSSASSNNKHGKGSTKPTAYQGSVSTRSSATPTYFPLHIDPARRHGSRSPASPSSFREDLAPFQPASPEATTTDRAVAVTPCREKPAVLIADDNSVNLSILKRRLEKMGHEVRTSFDGQVCFETFQNNQDEVDFILMDINMPLVDGIQSTKMIRALEHVESPTSAQPSTQPSAQHSLADSFQTTELQQTAALVPLMSPPPTNPGVAIHAEPTEQAGYFNMPMSPPASDPVSRQGSQVPASESPATDPPSSSNTSPPCATGEPKILQPVWPQFTNRVPIFAVSASLIQHSQASLQAAGFDGWLSKPIDFKRLGIILEGVVSRDARTKAKSGPGDFKGGGWFD
ncbi:hypothetical protein K458DRAFT_434754 [Lentithecium fluviatile CBS 122367]|uniref:Uncharacterized protein n=1 Tax=Lentithecium fluviatile CBS 122367 TaxID=1168545 RepID=A0A6G1INM9_9PLEO|nr:hypothetical protein K458DRAFT_434754 [Lentithecium fluviatile CBS 122367]